MMDKEIETKLKAAMVAYEEHFGESVGMLRNDPPMPEEFIDDIYKCIANDTPYKYPECPADCLF